MKRKPSLAILGLAFAAGYLGTVTLGRKKFLNWGATDEEIKSKLPGDEFMERMGSTRAVTIDAPVEEVWHWLVQIGQDRGGFYSYDWLERLVGAEIHNADRLHPEWQTLKPGDRVRLASDKLYGDIPLLKVLAIETNQYIVLEQWGAFILRPTDDGRTRFIIRTHTTDRALVPKTFDILFFEPLHFVMERKMLLGLKERAEKNYRTFDRQKQLEAVYEEAISPS